MEQLLSAEGFIFEPEPFSSFCRTLVSGPKALGSSLAAFFGLIYIQDRSSMLPPLALNPPPGAGALDMCASPGSKTGLLAQLVGAAGFVIGNEPTASRLATLRRNLHTMNLPQTVCVSRHGQQLPFADNSFGFILLDPPCSGWGTDKKHPGIKDLWKGEKIQPLVALQRLLLKKAAVLLRPGGRLVYSTCTTNRAENEEQVAYALEQTDLQMAPLPRFPGFEYDDSHLGLEQALRINGDSSEAQGFFIACFEKKANAGEVGAGRTHTGEESSSRFPQDGSRYSPWQRLTTAQGAKIGPVSHELNASHFAVSPFNPALLPQGRIFARGDACFFAPEGALGILPDQLEWHGFQLGKYKNGLARFSPRMRLLLPGSPVAGSVNFEDVAPLHGLLSGQSLKCELANGEAGLYWRGLPLGSVQIKNSRMIWNVK